MGEGEARGTSQHGLRFLPRGVCSWLEVGRQETVVWTEARDGGEELTYLLCAWPVPGDSFSHHLTPSSQPCEEGTVLLSFRCEN